MHHNAGTVILHTTVWGALSLHEVSNGHRDGDLSSTLLASFYRKLATNVSQIAYRTFTHSTSPTSPPSAIHPAQALPTTQHISALTTHVTSPAAVPPSTASLPLPHHMKHDILYPSLSPLIFALHKRNLDHSPNERGPIAHRVSGLLCLIVVRWCWGSSACFDLCGEILDLLVLVAEDGFEERDLQVVSQGLVVGILRPLVSKIE